jgi:Lrp/AsnC family leucine-responsive transcriptional regulator
MEMDARNCEIVALLQENARLSFAELGRKVGLSTPAVIERVRQLEEEQIILGYHAQINPAAVGLPVVAIVRVTVDGSRIVHFAEQARRIPEILSCFRITGADSYLVQVAVRDTQHLEDVIDAMMPYAATNTSLVLCSPFDWKPVTPSRALPRRARKKTLK